MNQPGGSMPSASTVKSDFNILQLLQQAATFIWLVAPPADQGTTWS